MSPGIGAGILVEGIPYVAGLGALDYRAARWVEAVLPSCDRESGSAKVQWSGHGRGFYRIGQDRVMSGRGPKQWQQAAALHATTEMAAGLLPVFEFEEVAESLFALGRLMAFFDDHALWRRQPDA